MKSNPYAVYIVIRAFLYCSYLLNDKNHLLYDSSSNQSDCVDNYQQALFKKGKTEVMVNQHSWLRKEMYKKKPAGFATTLLGLTALLSQIKNTPPANGTFLGYSLCNMLLNNEINNGIELATAS